MIDRFVKGLLILLSVLWMAGSGWALFGRAESPDAEAYRRQMFDQKMKDCRGQFSQRYDCMSTLLRQQSSDLAESWAGRLLLIFGPPLAVGLAYALIRGRRETQRERERNLARLQRREREAMELQEADRRVAAADAEAAPLREIDEIRRRANERRLAVKQKRDVAGENMEG